MDSDRFVRIWEGSRVAYISPLFHCPTIPGSRLENQLDLILYSFGNLYKYNERSSVMRLANNAYGVSGESHPHSIDAQVESKFSRYSCSRPALRSSNTKPSFLDNSLANPYASESCLRRIIVYNKQASISDCVSP